MKTGKKWLTLILCFVLFSPSTYGQSSTFYKVGPGDKLSISVPIQGSLRDLSKITLFLPIQIVGESIYSQFQVLVDPEGNISFPSIPLPVHVNELTVDEIEKRISGKLYLPSKGGSVSVSVLEVGSQPFYVWGSVMEPGRYMLARPITLVEGLSMAGGPNRRASLKKVTLLRDKEEPLIFNLTNKNIRKNGIPDIDLRKNDTILVPKKWTADISGWYLVFAIIGTMATVSIAVNND